MLWSQAGLFESQLYYILAVRSTSHTATVCFLAYKMRQYNFTKLCQGLELMQKTGSSGIEKMVAIGIFFSIKMYWVDNGQLLVVDHTPHTLFMEQFFNTAAKSQDMSSIGVEPEYGFTSIFWASSPFSQCYITFSTCVLPISLHQVELSLHMLPIDTLVRMAPLLLTLILVIFISLTNYSTIFRFKIFTLYASLPSSDQNNSSNPTDPLNVKK